MYHGRFVVGPSPRASRTNINRAAAAPEALSFLDSATGPGLTNPARPGRCCCLSVCLSVKDSFVPFSVMNERSWEGFVVLCCVVFENGRRDWTSKVRQGKA